TSLTFPTALLTPLTQLWQHRWTSLILVEVSARAEKEPERVTNEIDANPTRSFFMNYSNSLLTFHPEANRTARISKRGAPKNKRPTGSSRGTSGFQSRFALVSRRTTTERASHAARMSAPTDGSGTFLTSSMN